MFVFACVCLGICARHCYCLHTLTYIHTYVPVCVCICKGVYAAKLPLLASAFHSCFVVVQPCPLLCDCSSSLFSFLIFLVCGDKFMRL